MEDIAHSDEIRGKKLSEQKNCIEIESILQGFFTIVLLIVMMFVPFLKVDRKCYINVFSKDDKVAAPCVKVMNGYYAIYALSNIIAYAWYKCINKSADKNLLLTRRSLKTSMRKMVFILYPLLYLQIILMTCILIRTLRLRSSFTCVDNFYKAAVATFSLTLSHGIFITFEMYSAVKFAVRRATNKSKPRTEYIYESSDEEDDRLYIEDSIGEMISMAIETRRIL
jgi:hypothetical protein